VGTAVAGRASIGYQELRGLSGGFGGGTIKVATGRTAFENKARKDYDSLPAVKTLRELREQVAKGGKRRCCYCFKCERDSFWLKLRKCQCTESEEGDAEDDDNDVDDRIEHMIAETMLGAYSSREANIPEYCSFVTIKYQAADAKSKELVWTWAQESEAKLTPGARIFSITPDPLNYFVSVVNTHARCDMNLALFFPDHLHTARGNLRSMRDSLRSELKDGLPVTGNWADTSFYFALHLAPATFVTTIARVNPCLAVLFANL